MYEHKPVRAHAGVCAIRLHRMFGCRGFQAPRLQSPPLTNRGREWRLFCRREAGIALPDPFGQTKSDEVPAANPLVVLR